MVTPPPGDIWLDERLVVEESIIEGYGLFFSTDIAADRIVIKLGGKLVATAELEVLIAEADADPRAPFVDTITIDEDEHLVLPANTAIHFGNHSELMSGCGAKPIVVGGWGIDALAGNSRDPIAISTCSSSTSSSKPSRARCSASGSR